MSEFAKVKVGQWVRYCEESWIVTKVTPFETSESYAGLEIAKLETGCQEYITVGETWKLLGRARWLVRQYGERPAGSAGDPRFNFTGLIDPSGRRCAMIAGCRVFSSFKDMKSHWSGDDRRYRSWMQDKANDLLNAWSMQQVEKLRRSLAKVRAAA